MIENGTHKLLHLFKGNVLDNFLDVGSLHELKSLKYYLEDNYLIIVDNRNRILTFTFKLDLKNA